MKQSIIRHKILSLGLLAVIAVGSKAKAEAFSIPTLETSTISTVLDSVATMMAFRPVEGASDLGVRWGVTLGLGVSATESSAISSLSSAAPAGFLPGADLQLGIGLPKGITLELGMIPTFSYQSTSFGKYAGALKLNLNRTLLKKFPLAVAARLAFTKSSILYSQTSGSGTVGVDLDSSIYGGNIVVSKYLGALGFGLEPFLGVGFLAHSSNVTATGTGNLFGSSFPAGTTSTSASGSGLWYQAGLMLKLGVIGITAEYDHLFGLTSYAGKLSLRF